MTDNQLYWDYWDRDPEGLRRIENEVADRIDMDRRVQTAIDAGDNAEADRIMEEWDAEVGECLRLSALCQARG